MEKILIIFTIFLSSIGCLKAGAPALNKVPIPPAPYSLYQTNHLIMGVIWNKKAILNKLPKSFLNQSEITGGINIFYSKKKQSFYPLSGVYGWVDIPNTKRKEKLIIFSIYGPNKTINNIMKSIYNLQSEIGSNKVRLLNDKVVATASIDKKNVIVL